MVFAGSIHNPLQLFVLRKIPLQGDVERANFRSLKGTQAMLSWLRKYATIIVATVPILLVYPFLQNTVAPLLS